VIQRGVQRLSPGVYTAACGARRLHTGDGESVALVSNAGIARRNARFCFRSSAQGSGIRVSQGSRPEAVTG